MFTFNGFLAKLKTKFSTNKTPTNNHRFPLVLSDGTPDGNATPADVMQLLGAFGSVKDFNNTELNQKDLNNETSTCIGYVSAQAQTPGHAPLNPFPGVFIIFNIFLMCVQFAINRDSNTIYYRSKNIRTSEDWTTWKTISAT